MPPFTKTNGIHIGTVVEVTFTRKMILTKAEGQQTDHPDLLRYVTLCRIVKRGIRRPFNSRDFINSIFKRCYDFRRHIFEDMERFTHSKTEVEN